MAQNTVFNYFWKKYDFTNKTFDGVLDEHPYCKAPSTSMSK